MKLRVKEIPIKDIIVQDRAREDLGSLTSLKKSIQKTGLINPITVAVTDEGYKLLAGGRRLAAVKELGWDKIPAVVLNQNDEMEHKIIELHENLLRKNFSWQEEVKLKQQIHHLYVERHGLKQSPSDKEGWSIRETAKILGESPTTVSKDLRLAELMPQYEEIQEADTKTAAYKRMQRLIDDFQAAVVIQAVQTPQKDGQEQPVEKTALKKTFERYLNAYVVGDFFQLVNDLPDGYYDLVEVDPPYGIDLQDKKRGNVERIEQYNEVDAATYPQFIEQVVEAILPKMRDNSWLIWWYAFEPWQEVVFKALRKAGLSGLRIPGLWVKPIGQVNHPDMYFARTVEPFYYMRKGSPVLVQQGKSPVFQYSKDNDHPAGRPVALMRDILQRFIHPGARVLVPFAGSGATLVAAFELGAQPIGFDLSEEYKMIYTNLIAKSVAL